MLHGSHVESICNMIQVDADHVWSVSDTDRCLCVWRLGKEAAAPSAGAASHSTSLGDSNPAAFL
jgi:hypothetical protein